MQILRSLAVLTALALVVASCSRAASGPAAVHAPFSDLTYEQALERARADGRVLLLDFTASWCPPCREMEKTTWPDPRVQEWIAEEAVALQIDIDRDKSQAAALGISSIPTIVFLDGDGKQLGRFTGYRDPDGFLEEAGPHAR